MIAGLTSTICDETGRPYRLGPKLGTGGEGDVFSVEGDPKLAVKLYHKKPDPEKVDKLRVMVRTGSDKLSSFSTWPQAIISSSSSSSSAAMAAAVHGFVMPRLAPSYKEVLQLY
ncbi:MAG: hypothetical protein ACRD3W_30420, partial [Terriglobales bacterium]